MLQSKAQTFNDGMANIYSVSNESEAGGMPKEKLELKSGGLRYDERIVGVSRFWAASREQTKIERLLRMPRNDSILRADVVVPIDGNQYKVVQVQYPPDVYPPCMDLSLERLVNAYDIA